ncbi:tetratricopeptide repeat protein [Niveibacterium sp. SC-1]|uniref:L,D-transpeptidase Cds6 family protein n=1 Tax=Niveibacterium sp. SC-1 TaxID=3135646 RepID=UPI00311EF048
MTLKPFYKPLRALALVSGLFFAGLAHGESTLPEIQAYMRQGQHAVALDKLNELLAAKPKDAQLRFTKGVVLTELKRTNEAIAIYQQLIKDYPELPEPYNNLAVIYASQREYEKARAALEMAIRTHPAYATAHENLGDVYSKLASQAYDKALQLDSSNTQAQTKLAMIGELIGANNRAGLPAAGAPVAAKPAAPVVVAKAEPKPETKPAAESKPAPVKPEPKSEPKAEPKVEAKPEPKAEPKAEVKPEAKPELKDNEEPEIRKVVSNWAAAWSRKDVKAYLAAYSANFDTPRDMPRKAWEAERESRIDKPGTIRVEVEDLKISREGNKALARFRQRYESASLKSATRKTLVLERTGRGWQIQQERVGN